MCREHSAVSRRLAIVVLGLALAVSPVVSAQVEQPAAFAERVEVDLVNVEVWVTDSNGEAVRGLTREDFTVLHDGAPVPVTHFSEVDQGTPARDARIEDGATEGLDPSLGTPHLVVVLDLFRLARSSQKRIVRDLRSFLESGDVAPERVLVLQLEDGLGIAAPFGSSAPEIDAVLEALQKRASSSTDWAADRRQVVGALDDLWTDLNRSSNSASIRSIVEQVTGPTASQGAAASGAEEGSPGAAGSSFGIACEDFVDRATPILVAWGDKERADTTETLRKLGDVASFLSGLEGPKTLLYASDGLGLAPGVAATGFVRGVCPAYQTDLEIDTLPGTMGDSFEALARRMSSNRITLYALQGSGLSGGLAGGAGQTSSERRGVRGFERSSSNNAKLGLSLLAERTGGHVAEGGSHERALTRIAEEMGSYYSVGYPPPHSGAERHHELSVQLPDSSLTVRHRRSFSDKTPGQWLMERLESALYLGMVTNPLAVRLGAGDVAPAEGALVSFPLHLVVPVERLTFAERAGQPMAQLLVRVMALHAESRTLVLTDRPMMLPRPGEGTLDVFDLKLDLQLEAGVQMMAIAIQDRTSGEASFVSTTVDLGSDPANS